MENLTATDYTWFIMIGLTLGWLFDLIFEDKGIGMMTHLIIGVLTAVFGGLVFAVTGLEAELIFAVINATLFPFLTGYVSISPSSGKKTQPEKPNH